MLGFELRNYDQLKDYVGLRSLLEEAELYDDDYESADKLQRWTSIHPDALVVAAIEGQIVGSVYFQDGIIPYIFRLAVRESHRNQGIGTALLNEAERRAQAVGHEFVELNVASGHPELVDWYVKRGYEPRTIYTDMVKQF